MRDDDGTQGDADPVNMAIKHALGEILTCVEAAIPRSQFIPMKKLIRSVFYEKLRPQLLAVRRAVIDQASRDGNNGEEGGA